MTSRRGLYLIPALAVVVYCAAMLWGLHRLEVQRDAIAESSRTGAWIASQASLERERFLNTLDRYALGDPAVSHEDIVLRFDLFWSRVPLIVTGPEAQRLRQIPQAAQLVEELQTALETIEPLVQGLRPESSEDYRTIRAEMDRFASPLHDLMLTAMGQSDLGPQRSSVEEAFHFLRLSYFAVLVIGGAAIALIIWLTARGLTLQRAQQLSADEAEAERGRLRDAIESISDGFVYYDSDMRLVHCNQRYREFYPWIDDVLVPGARLEDVARAAAKRGQDAEPITDTEAWVGQRMQEFRSGRASHEQHLRDGRWLLCSESRTQDGGFVGIRSDITERKRAETELKDSEQQFSKAFHASPALFAISRPEDGAHYDVNETWMRTLGYTYEEAMAGSAHELEIWANPDERARFVKRLEKERSVRGFEAKFRTKSGEELDFLVSGEYLEVGGEPRLFVVSHDITERKQAEEALRVSAQRLKDIAEAASDWFWELDAELRFTYVSDRYEEVAGTSPERLYGKRPEQVYPRSAERQPELWEKYFAAVGAQEDFRDFIHDDFRQDGQRRVISNTGKAVFHADGSFAGYRGTSTDITAQREAEEALRKAEALFRSFIEHSPTAISIKELDGSYSLISPSASRHLGLGADDNSGEGLAARDVFTSETAAAIEAADRTVLETGMPLRHDQELVGKFGAATLLLTKFPIQDASGLTVGIGTIGIDITERRKAEEAVRTRDAWLRAILDNAPIEIVLKDTEGRIIAASRTVAEALGLDHDAVLGRTTADLLPEHVASVYTSADRQVAESGQLLQQEVVENLDGTPRHLLNAKFPLRDDSGEIAGICSITSDITEMKEMQLQLHQAQKMETVGQLTGGVAHDFNNLLAVIMGNAEVLEARLGGGDRSAQAILRAATRGAELTQRLLAFSRRQPLRPQVIELGELVAGMTDLLQRTLGETVVIGTTCAEDLWPAEADPGQVENALLNLAVNARDAMPDGGKLLVDCSNASLDEHYVASHLEATPGDYVLLSVSDTGGGMSPEVLEHAFEPFFTTKEVGAGSGLGLSMVYGFAKQSGGEVAIYSEPGKGTTVKLYLPRARAAAEVAKPSVAGEIPQARGETILVVEDDPDVRALAETVLEDLGYRVLTAADGQAGLAALENGRDIDLLLSDVVLPGAMSGPALAQQARHRISGLKVLFMSGYAESEVQHHSALPDNAPLLNKPFRKRQLAQQVREVLDREAS